MYAYIYAYAYEEIQLYIHTHHILTNSHTNAVRTELLLDSIPIAEIKRIAMI